METQINLTIVTILLLLLGLGFVVVVVEGRAPVLHEVGGDRFGWRINVNFVDWAAQQRFYVGDWLYFGFDKKRASVLEVNKTSYQNCIDTNFITNITRGGRDVFNLTAARPYYFISGRGYCPKGLKLAITVQEAPPDPLPPPPTPSHVVSKKSPFSFFTSSGPTITFFQPSDHFHFITMIMIMTINIYVAWALI